MEDQHNNNNCPRRRAMDFRRRSEQWTSDMAVRKKRPTPREAMSDRRGGEQWITRLVNDTETMRWCALSRVIEGVINWAEKYKSETSGNEGSDTKPISTKPERYEKENWCDDKDNGK